MNTEDEFVVVERRRGRRNTNNTNNRSHNSARPDVTPFVRSGADFPNCQIDKATAIRRIFAAREDLLESDYYKSFLTILKECLEVIDYSSVVEIICYGLGHIGDSTASRYQLSLALCLRNHFTVECLVHDPIFYSDECDVLESLGLTLIKENEEGKHKIRTDGITIVFMPHCPKQLANNFLWKNWDTSLKNCVLICNSFTTLIETQPHRQLNSSVPYILNIASHAKEYNLINCFKFHNVFNDLSIHIFPENRLSHITDNFWTYNIYEPTYSDEVELVTIEVIDKLRIKESIYTFK